MFGDKKIKIKDSERSLISETVSIEGTINSSGAIDVAGLIKGPVYSKELIIRDTGSITGSIEADDVEIAGNLRTENGADIDGYIKKTNNSKSKLTGDFLFKKKDKKDTTENPEDRPDVVNKEAIA